MPRRRARTHPEPAGVTAAQAESVGPGWEYYLDRLVDAETGADPSARDFERDYYPAMRDYYRTQF